MSNYILADWGRWSEFLPFTYTRPVGAIRTGILTIQEKWKHYLGELPSFLTEEYLSRKFTAQWKEINVLINTSILPDAAIAAELKKLKPGSLLKNEDQVIAFCGSQAQWRQWQENEHSAEIQTLSYTQPLSCLQGIWSIFSLNSKEIEKDFRIITKNRKSAGTGSDVHIINPENIFIEEGAQLTYCCIDASQGPVYIGREATVTAGSLVQGPFSLGEHSTLKMGAKIYPGTTIGPHCKVGGEVNNSVFFGFANKAHDGFIGNSVIGEWCNIGADSNNSNLKNTYEPVKIWNYNTQSFQDTGLTFCGLFLGDHTKCGINTMFNTGTVAGVSSNIFGGGFPRTFIPSFSWGGPAGFSTFKFDKAMQVARTVMARRKLNLSDEDVKILKHIFENSAENRT
ncbi:MAG: GlmU family protein [Bacteroidia bacterium]